MTLPSSAPCLRVFGLAVSLGLTLQLAHADNDAMRLTRLTSADLALMLTNVCLDADPSTLRAWEASPDAVRARAQRVKDEVSVGLSEIQLLSVLRRAADAARAIALRAVGALTSSNPALERSKTSAWCDGPARAMVEGFMKEDASAQ